MILNFFSKNQNFYSKNQNFYKKNGRRIETEDPKFAKLL